MRKRSRSIVKGAIAGFFGGLVAAAVKSAADKVYPPRSSSELKSPSVLTSKPGSHELTLEKRHSPKISRFGMGAAAGAAYGAVAELYPSVTAKQGASFGMALVAMTHDTSLPFLGRAAKPEPETQREQTSELVSFVIYGVVTETVRRIVRRMIN